MERQIFLTWLSYLTEGQQAFVNLPGIKAVPTCAIGANVLSNNQPRRNGINMN
jgi:hypothetical protein